MSETNGKRRKRSSPEKLRIVLSGLQADTKIAELCRRDGITANQFYNRRVACWIRLEGSSRERRRGRAWSKIAPKWSCDG